ncbi:R1 [Symbiodinium microadriaticum]|nr:R1 [Symbiodinium microadriaticum]
MPSSDRAEEPASPPPASRWVYTRVAEAADTPPGVIAMPKHCILFQAGHSVRHFLAHLRAPFTRSAIMQEALDYYPELRDHWVLLETVPQVAEGAASLIAVPSWTQAADRAIFLLDFSAYNGPVFAWFDWSYVNRTSLASIARVYAQTPWEVFYGNRDVPLGPEEAVTASPGHVFRFQPKGTMQLSRPLLSNMLQDMSLWQDAPPAVPRERLACDWCVMMSHVTRVIPHIGYSRSEIQAQAAVALDSDLNDLIFGYPKPHSPLNDLVFRGTLMRGVFAAVPRSASGARVGIFAFVDPRAIGLNPTFLHVAEGDLHISHVLGILGFRVPTGFQLQVSGVPFSEQIAQVSDECTLELSVVPVARAIPAPLQLSASPGPGQRDLASAGAERNGAHGAHAATRIWPRAFRRDDPPPPDPEAHLNLATGDSDEEELAVDGEAFIDASFLIFAPRFQPELVRLVLQAPCDVDTALRALSDTQNSAFDLSFDCLLPAVPQPDTAFGSVLAVPPWDRRGSHVLVDSRQVDGRLFALSFHGRLSRAAFLVKAGFKQMHGLEVYLHGRVLDHRDWYQFLAGDTVFVRQTAVPLPPPVALADMLRDRHDWHYPCPSFEGPHLVAFLLLTDEGSRVVAIDPDEVSTTAAFRAEVERILGYDRRNTAVCPIQPRLVDLSVLGQRCKSVVAVTQIVLNPPPSTLQASPPLHVVFLDARLLLKDISWVVAAEGLIEIPAVLECFQQDAPFGFSVEATGVPTEILDGSDYFRAPHGSCVRLTYVQDSSAVGSSDGNTDGGLVLDQDETTGSSSDGEPSASSSEAEPRPGDAQLEPCQRERSRSRTRPGANRSTKTGIWMAGLAAVHAASAVPASSTATLSPTASVLLDRAAVEQADFCLWCAIVSFGLLLLVGLLLSAALRRHRLLQEPRGDTASSQAHLDTLRSFVPILGGPWHPRLPYDLGHLVEPDIDDQEAQAAGIREEVRTVQCLILTYDFTPNVHSVDLPLPTTTEDLVQAGIAVWIGPDLQLLPPGHRTHVFPGMLVLFLPEETEPPVLLSLGQLLLLRHVWGNGTTLTPPDFGPAYCLAGRGQGQLMLADLHNPARYRRQISEVTGACLHRMRIFAGDPRPLDVALHGVPCHTVVAVGERRRTTRPEVWHMAIFDCRFLERGWCAAYVVNGVLNLGSILDDFNNDAPLGWRTILLGDYPQSGLLPARPGQVFVLAYTAQEGGGATVTGEDGAAAPTSAASNEVQPLSDTGIGDPEAGPTLQHLTADDAEVPIAHRLPFFVLMPEYVPEVVVVQTSLPVTTEQACALVDAERDAHNQHRFPRLLSPQLQPALDTPCLLAVPDWTFTGVPILIVSFVLPFRLFTVVVPPIIFVGDVLHLAKIETHDVSVFVGDLPWASPLSDRLHVQAGTLFTVFPEGHLSLPETDLTFLPTTPAVRLLPGVLYALDARPILLELQWAYETDAVTRIQIPLTLAAPQFPPLSSCPARVLAISNPAPMWRCIGLMLSVRFFLRPAQAVRPELEEAPADIDVQLGPTLLEEAIRCPDSEAFFLSRTLLEVLVDYFSPPAPSSCQKCPAPPSPSLPVQVSLCERLPLTAHQESVLKLESLVPAETPPPSPDWLDTDLGPLLRDPLVPPHKRRLFEAVQFSNQVPTHTPCTRLLVFSDGSTGVATAASGNCAAGAWALSVWLETDSGLYLVGHAAGTTRPPHDLYNLGERDDSPLTCELLGLAWGLIWVIEYAAAYSMPVVCLYDCTAAGHGTFAVARIPAGSQDPAAALATFTMYLRQLAAQRVLLSHEHVKGHSGQLGNELCDELAKHCRRRPPASDQVMLPEWPARVFAHPLKSWMWLAASGSSDLPTLFAFESEALRMQSSPLPTLSDPSMGFVAAPSSSEPVQLSCTFMSYNVLSLYDPHSSGKGPRGPGMRVVAKRDILKQQVTQLGVLFLGLQETRLPSSEVLPDKDFIMLHSSSDPQGHHGVALWVAKRVSYAVVADEPRFLQREHLTVTGLSPRWKCGFHPLSNTVTGGLVPPGLRRQDTDIVLTTRYKCTRITIQYSCESGCMYPLPRLLLGFAAFLHAARHTSFSPQAIVLYDRWVRQARQALAGASGRLRQVGLQLRAAVRQDRAQYLAGLVENISFSDIRDPKHLYRAVRKAFPSAASKRRRAFTPLPAVADKDGVLAADVKAQRALWREHFASLESGELLPPGGYAQALMNQKAANVLQTPCFDLAVVPTLTNVEQSVLGLKNGKACGQAFLACKNPSNFEVFQAFCHASARPWALLFFDVKSAFYRVVRQLLLPVGDSDRALLELFHRLRLPPAALSELKAHLEGLATVPDSGCGEHLQRVATDVLQGTWFRLDKDVALTLTHCGTRPGDGLADLFFGFAFSAYLRAADEALLVAGLATPMPVPRDTEPWELSVPGTLSCGSWADDFVHMHSQPEVVGLGRAINKSPRYQEKDELWPRHPTGASSLLTITSAVSGNTHCLPIVSAYCHLGGIVTATLTPAPDIGLRHALAANGVRSLGRRLFSAQKIPLSTRRALLRSLVLSKFVFGSSTIRFGAALHSRSWAKHYVALWRALIPRTKDAHQPHAYTVLRTAAAPSPPLALALARSVLLRQMARHGPHTLLRLLWVQWEVDPAGSWLGSVASDVSHASLYLPVARVLQASPCPLKALLEAVWDDPGWWTRQLKHATKIWLADLESWAAQPSSVPEPVVAHPDPPAGSSDNGQFFPCEFCGALFPLRKHLTVHLARRHEVISPTRLLAHGPTCVACLRHYHTVVRLQNHLKRSGACLYRSACLLPPLDIAAVREVELQDKAHKKRVLHGHWEDFVAPLAPCLAQGPQQLTASERVEVEGEEIADIEAYVDGRSTEGAGDPTDDIPAGITAILLPAGQAVDTLSHVAIRARNQQVLLASCDEEAPSQATLAELRRLAGTPLRLQVSASGDVTWEKAELPTKASAAATSAPTRLAETMQKPPKPPGIVLPSADFTKNSRSIGGKSLHLAELAAASGGFAVPNSATVPYGVFEQVLSESANHGLLEELEEILAEGALEEARQFLVDELAVPDEIGIALCKALGRSDLGDWKAALCRVWASKWTDRAVASRKQMKVPDSALYLAVLVQPLVFAQYAFVIHTQSPLPGAAKGEQLVELCVGLGESLVSNSPGRALSASVGDGGASITIHVFPSKPEGVFAPEGGTIIFRSDSNGEALEVLNSAARDLEGFAGAGLYDSVTVQSCEHRTINYAAEPLFFDAGFRSKLLKSLFELGRKIEANFAGQPQDIEGAVTAEGKVVVTQSRPQV